MSKIISVVSTDSQLLQSFRETGMPCVPLSGDALSALAEAGSRHLDLLVIDLRGQSQIPSVVPAIKRQHPSAGVLLVASHLEPALMLEAMRAGVNEVVTDPVSIPELRAAVNRLLGTLAPGPRGDVFAFVGAKGGVGTTTVAVNVATALAKLSPSTLLIDLNIACGDAAVFLGAEPRFSVLDALANVQRLDAAYFGGLLVRSKSGPDLLGAATGPVTGGVDAARLRALLEFATDAHRYTVLDVPRSDSAALDSLEAATRIVIVVNQELASVRNATKLAAALRQRYGQGKLGMVLSRTDRRAEIGHDDVERTVGIDISHTLPSDYRLALQAMNKGRPIVLDTQHELARAVVAFARGLAGVKATDKPHPARIGSLFGRLAAGNA